MSDHKPGRSLFWTILMPQFFVLAAMILMLTISSPLSGAGTQITKNYQDVVSLQTDNQGEYLATHMSDQRHEISSLCDVVTAAVQERIDKGTLTARQLVSNSHSYNSLLLEVSGNVSLALHNTHASGIYVMFAASIPDGSTGLPCLYIRNQNAGHMQSGDKPTLLYAPEDLCDDLPIALDENWQPMFLPQDNAEYSYFYNTLRAANAAISGTSSEVLGRWTLVPRQNGFSLYYTEPLILKNGTVVGTVGVEILPDCLSTLLPAGELLDSAESGYILAMPSGNSDGSLQIINNGCAGFLRTAPGSMLNLSPLEIGGYSLMHGDREFYTAIHAIEIYDHTSLQSGQKWYLIGTVGMNEMFSFANNITRINIITILLTMLVGAVSAITVSRKLAKPISRLADEVALAGTSKNTGISFTNTGIAEIDHLSESFRSMLQETVDTSTKFLSIMDMASVELAGYEWREGSDGVYVTDNFFPMLGMDHVDAASLSVQEFNQLLQDIRTKMGASITLDGSRIYSIRHGDSVHYIRAESTQDGDRHVGLLEDVTRSTQERIRIEHERDYDVLTGLYNRRAFYNRAGMIFNGAESLNFAALIVLDIDDLKMTNDRFGHDWGDRYLRQVAQIIQEHAPKTAICARISGDEIYILLHSYLDKSKLRRDIEKLMRNIRSTTLQLPNGEALQLSVSGGISVYPDDSMSLQELVKYSDFAMYQAKSNRKGFVLGFDPEEYAKNETFLRGRGELREMIEQEKVVYHFQPIFSAEDARPAAYEALMRVNMPSIKSPDVVMRLAEAEGSQYHIERITMFKACESYRDLLTNGQVCDDSMLFINSLPDQSLTEKDAQRFHEEYAELQSRIVLEITEDEYLGLDALEIKRNYPGFSGRFALDDYGSGYNGEMNLLLLQPNFVKVDVVFIRGIDSNPDRQQLVSSLVSYAHSKNMKVVAEGIETAEELRTVLELGVDLFQGYFLARPAAIPSAIAPQAEKIIKEFSKAS